MKKGYLFIAITTVLFSSMEIALKFISGAFNPIQLTFSRFFIGGIVLLPFAYEALKKKGLRIRWHDIGAFALCGLVGIALSMSLYQFAVTNTEASVVAILFSSNPLFVLVFAYLFLHEAIYKRNLVALALDIVGIVFIIKPWEMKLNAVGVICALAAALLFALYGVLGKRKSKEFGGVVSTCGGFLTGSVEMMLLALLTHIPAVSNALTNAGLSVFASIPFFQGWSLKVLPVALYVCIGVTGIGFTSYFKAMEYTSANTTSLVFFFKPILAPLMALAILGEEILWNRWVGIAFILAGSLCNILPGIIAEHRPQQKA